MVYRGFPKGHGGDGYMLNIYIYIYLVISIGWPQKCDGGEIFSFE